MEITGMNLSEMESSPFLQPWAISKYSWKVAKTPKRESVFLEKEVALEEVLLENYVGDALLAIERITGLTLIDRSNDDELRIMVPKLKHDDGPALMGKLARMVVDKGRKSEVMEFLRMKREGTIIQIKESPEYEGRLYFNEYYDCEYYDQFDRMKQEFEAARRYLTWLDIVIEELTIHQEHNGDVPVDKNTASSLLIDKDHCETEQNKILHVFNKGKDRTTNQDNASTSTDSLFQCDYTPQQVRAYFMQLAELGFYTEQQIDYLLKSNFTVFAENKAPLIKVKLPIVEKLIQKQLTYFVRQFCFKQAKKKMTMEQGCKLLFDNFQYYENIEFKTVKNHMSEEPIKYPFSTTALA